MTSKRRPKPRQKPRQYRDLASYIERTGDTQQRIAAAVGSTQAHISRIAAGDIVPRPALAQRIATYARIPLDSFTRVHLANLENPSDLAERHV